MSTHIAKTGNSSPSTGFDTAETNVLLHENIETGNTTDTEFDGKPLPPPPRGGGKSQNWFARVFQLKPATRVIALNTSTTKARKYIHKTMREWKKWGMEEVYLDKDKRVIYGSVGEVNCTSSDHTDQIKIHQGTSPTNPSDLQC